jgi:excisionase family DNA binding protein
MEFEAITCTIKDACRISGLGRSTLYELIRSGEVLASKIGRRTLVDVNSLRETICRHRVQTLILPQQLGSH